MEKNAEYGRQSEIIAQVHVWREQSLFTVKTQTQALYLEKFLMIALVQTILIIQKNVTTLRVT